MYERRMLMAMGPGRPLRWIPLRISGVRHASQIRPGNRQRADEKGSNTMDTNPPPEQEGRPYNAPNFSKSRQQRSAQMSEEVQMLSRDTPTARANQSNSPYPRIQSRNVDAEAVGRSPTQSDRPMGGQMGNNASPEREGPYAQSAGRTVRAQDAPDESRSEHNPSGAVVEPSEGGAGLLDDEFQRQMSDESLDEFEVDDEDYEEAEEEEDEDEDEDDDEDEDEVQDGYSTQHELAILENFNKEDVGTVAFDPEPVTRDAYLRLGQGGATIAGGNFEGVIEDRLMGLSERTQDGFRDPVHLAKRLESGDFVSFQSEEEKTRVLEAFSTHQVLSPYPKRQDNRRADKPPNAHKSKFGRLSDASQEVMLDKLVRGKYGDMKATQYKQDLLNQVASATLKNGTYLADDGTKFLKKVQSLLPTQMAARPPQTGGRSR